MCGLFPGLSKKSIIGLLRLIDKAVEGESLWLVPRSVLKGTSVSSDHSLFGLLFPTYFDILEFYLSQGIFLLLYMPF